MLRYSSPYCFFFNNFRGTIHKNTDVGDKWSVPFPGSDRSVVLRTQRYMYEVEKKRPVQVQTYMVAGSLLNVIRLAIFGLVFTLFAHFKFTADFLLKVTRQLSYYPTLNHVLLFV